MDENRKLTQADKVALELRKMILEKQLPPGQRINQEELSKVLGVSKIPFREALKLLEAEGLVYSEPYKGSFVSHISIDYIEETYFLRSVLEGISCAQATVRMDQQDLQELHTIMERSEQSFFTNETVTFIEYSKKFHDYIHSFSGYLRLRQMIENLRTGILPLNVDNLKEQGYKSLIEHQFIYEKIVKRDAEGAGNAMRMHLQRSGMDVIQQIKKIAKEAG